MSGEVFVSEIGQLTVRSARDLRKAGIVVVEVVSLDKCQFVRASEVLSGSDLAWAAVHALNLKGEYGSAGTGQRELFVRNVLTVIESLRASSVPAQEPQ